MTGNKKLNPKIGDGFENNAFGEGSIKIDITAEGLATIMQNLQVGGSILVKYNKVSKYGNKHYFCNILPPFEKSKTGTTKTAEPAGDLG